MPELRIGAHTARLPIMQGGMGVGVSLSGLASAVGNEGGIGEISAVGIGRDVVSNALTRVKDNYKGLRAEIAKARANTNGLISVNVMLALTDSNDLMRAALEEDVDIISLSAGLPIRRSQVTRGLHKQSSFHRVSAEGIKSPCG
ncbi:MAG: nitronate monooxygenase [Planctomycetota bacterium]|nr:nitronate monooxygenase [Planctomycetota bacterium]